MDISQLNISNYHRSDDHRRRKWKPSIVSSRLATLLQSFRGHLRSAMICDASRTSKSQENGPFHRNVWQGLIACKQVHVLPRRRTSQASHCYYGIEEKEGYHITIAMMHWDKRHDA